MHPTFEKFLEPIRDKTLSIGQRSFLATREISWTRQANDIAKETGDTASLKFGEEYLRVLQEVIEREGLRVNTG